MDKQTPIKFRVTFQPTWVLAQRNASMLPVDRTVMQIKEQLEGQITRSNLTECEGIISAKDPAQAEKALSQLVAEAFGIEPNDPCFTISVETAEETPEPEQSKTAEHAEPKKSAPKKQKAENSGSKKEKPENAETVLGRIRELIGAEDFKALAEECAKIAPLLKQSDTLEAFTRRCYLFSVNAGCGLSEYLALFADLIAKLGLFRFETGTGLPGLTNPKSVIEAVLPPPESDENIVDFMTKLLERNQGRLLSIDISAWMNKAEDPAFREVLRLAELHAGESILCFRVPFVEHNVLYQLHKQLNDQLFVRDVTIVPFDNAELERYGKQLLTDKNFTVSDDAWEIFRMRLNDEKNDGRFYGFHTVRKIILEMLYLKQLTNVENGTADTEIVRTDITKLFSGEIADEKTGDEMLAEMIGMEAIRDQVYAIVGQITAALENNALEPPCIHMRFLGSPGTGKTTVARIVGKLLREKGVLRVGGFVERSSRELCGRYIGETAPKTAAICRDAYGSVLFIDEAYSLYRGGDSSRRDYGLEAIDTLIAEMENHRADMVVIMAGYEKEMETLMEANAGLRSRMPFEIRFPNYTREQLADIFLLMARKSFTVSEGFELSVRDYFSQMTDAVLESKEFSNARFVRNLYERTWGKAVLRCQMQSIPCTELKPEDLSLALSDNEFQNVIGKHAKAIGFV